MRNVACVKWGTQYGPEFVNKLYGMVQRNTTEPFRFICLTDDSTSIRPEVETFSIESQFKGWWPKIQYFKSPFLDVEGPILALDLDNIIISNIDCFFEYSPNSFCMKRDFPKCGHSSCVMRFNVNEYSHIYDNLNLDEIDHAIDNSDISFKKKRYSGDQNWITEQMQNDPQGRKVVLWPKGWVVKRKELARKNINPARCSAKIVAWSGYLNDQRKDLRLVKDVWKE